MQEISEHEKELERLAVDARNRREKEYRQNQQEMIEHPRDREGGVIHE